MSEIKIEQLSNMNIEKILKEYRLDLSEKELDDPIFDFFKPLGSKLSDEYNEAVKTIATFRKKTQEEDREQILKAEFAFLDRIGILQKNKQTMSDEEFFAWKKNIFALGPLSSNSELKNAFGTFLDTIFQALHVKINPESGYIKPKPLQYEITNFDKIKSFDWFPKERSEDEKKEQIPGLQRDFDASKIYFFNSQLSTVTKNVEEELNNEFDGLKNETANSPSEKLLSLNFSKFTAFLQLNKCSDHDKNLFIGNYLAYQYKQLVKDQSIDETTLNERINKIKNLANQFEQRYLYLGKHVIDNLFLEISENPFEFECDTNTFVYFKDEKLFFTVKTSNINIAGVVSGAISCTYELTEKGIDLKSIESNHPFLHDILSGKTNYQNFCKAKIELETTINKNTDKYQYLNNGAKNVLKTIEQSVLKDPMHINEATKVLKATNRFLQNPNEIHQYAAFADQYRHRHPIKKHVFNSMFTLTGLAIMGTGFGLAFGSGGALSIPGFTLIAIGGITSLVGTIFLVEGVYNAPKQEEKNTWYTSMKNFFNSNSKIDSVITEENNQQTVIQKTN